jgi:hypothetical protein
VAVKLLFLDLTILALELSEVLAQSLDLGRLKETDQFEVLTHWFGRVVGEPSDH